MVLLFGRALFLKRLSDTLRALVHEDISMASISYRLFSASFYWHLVVRQDKDEALGGTIPPFSLVPSICRKKYELVFLSFFLFNFKNLKKAVEMPFNFHPSR